MRKQSVREMAILLYGEKYSVHFKYYVYNLFLHVIIYVVFLFYL